MCRFTSDHAIAWLPGAQDPLLPIYVLVHTLPTDEQSTWALGYRDTQSGVSPADPVSPVD